MPSVGGFNVYAQPSSFNAFRHRTSSGNIFGSVTDIDHPLLNGNPCARVHFTKSVGVTNNHHAGIYYVDGVNRWSIFNQDGALMPDGAVFNIVVDPQAVDCPIELFSDGFENP
jgi:hypothetical protein